MSTPAGRGDPTQQIRFCTAPDGVRIAYAVHGSGPALVVSTCWLSHLQFDWQSPVWRHFLADLGRVATVIRYDERGHGLSDWDAQDFGLDARIGDMEAVVDDAGVGRFALMGMAQGGPVSIAYADRHPERVTRMVFYGSYASAAGHETPEEKELDDAYGQLIRVGWARPESTFRRVFTSLMIPGASEEQKTWLDELMRMSSSADTAYRARQGRRTADASELVARLDLPTLILHSVGDQMNDFVESRRLAAAIPGSRLVPLESDNHIVLSDEPAWQVFLREVTAFLEPDRRDLVAAGLQSVDQLSPRELDVLRLAAGGCDNEAIAEELTLSVRTVERHLQNVYAKLGLSGRTARTAAVASLLSMG